MESVPSDDTIDSEIPPPPHKSGGEGDGEPPIEPETDQVIQIKPQAKVKPQPPLVPPKPSKSGHSGMNLLLSPGPDQSFLTDETDEKRQMPMPISMGCNSDSPSPLPLLPIGCHDHDRSRTKGPLSENASGDWSQKIMPKGPDEPDPIPSPNTSNMSNDDRIAEEEPIITFHQPASKSKSKSGGKCPFYKLHHRTPCEFLSLPAIPEIADEDKDILLGIDDPSSNVEHKISFILRNLENCGGIWPMMFLEKLNRLIVSKDHIGQVKACFREDESSIIQQLVSLYEKTKRCTVRFRFWCLFYNIMDKHLVPFPALVKSGILQLFKRDFVSSAKEECTCKDDPSTKSTSISMKPEDEHVCISSSKQMEILSILMIRLFSAQTDLKPPLDFDKEEDRFISTVLKVVNGQPILALKRLFSEARGAECQQDSDPVNKDILMHLLLAYNLQYPMKELGTGNPLVETILESKPEKMAIFKDLLIDIFKQEFMALKKENLDGIESLVSNEPYQWQDGEIGFKTVGIIGPLKLHIDILSCDNSNMSRFFDAFDVQDMLHIVYRIQLGLTKIGYSDDKTEEMYEHCQILKERLEYEVGFFQTEADQNLSDMDCSTSSHGSEGQLLSVNENEIQDSRKFTISRFGKLLQCFGCMRIKKATVAPARPEDRDYF